MISLQKANSGIFNFLKEDVLSVRTGLNKFKLAVWISLNELDPNRMLEQIKLIAKDYHLLDESETQIDEQRAHEILKKAFALCPEFEWMGLKISVKDLDSLFRRF